MGWSKYDELVEDEGQIGVTLARKYANEILGL